MSNGRIIEQEDPATLALLARCVVRLQFVAFEFVTTLCYHYDNNETTTFIIMEQLLELVATSLLQLWKEPPPLSPTDCRMDYRYLDDWKYHPYHDPDLVSVIQLWLQSMIWSGVVVIPSWSNSGRTTAAILF